MKLFLNFACVFMTTLLFSQTKKDTSAVLHLRNHIKTESENFVYKPELTKEQNRLLKERFQAKVKAEMNLIQSKSIIVEGVLYQRVEQIFNRILTANPSIPSNTKFVIYKSSDFNAFTMGDNLIFIHLGLLHSLKNDEEIGMVISHEIAHNNLKHIEQSMIDFVKYETDDSIKREIRDIMKQQYNQVSSLNALLLPRIFENREKSREHEYEADSLGLVYMINANFNPKKAIAAFVEMELRQTGQVEMIDLLKELNYRHIPELVAKENEYKRVGSLGVFEKDTSKLADYLATHPYERDRFLRLATQFKQDTIFANYTSKSEVADSSFRHLLNEEITRIELENKNFTTFVFFGCKSLLFHPNNSKDLKRLGLTFYALSYFKQKRIAGKFLLMQSSHYDESFDRICAFLYALSPDNCKKIADITLRNPNTKLHEEDLEYKLKQLLDFVEKKDFTSLEIFLSTNYETINKSEYSWIAKEILKQVYQTEKQKFLIPYIK